MRSPLLLSALFILLTTGTAFASRYGSETVVTIAGTYHLAGTQTDKKLKGGDVIKTTAYKTQKISNATVLSSLKSRKLIPATSGYSIVMVGQAHTADGSKFFAVAGSGTPVAIPTDLLKLTVSDGPRQGTLTVDKSNKLKALSAETRNLATLTVGKFSGSGILVQSWTSKPVVKTNISEVVELMNAKGTINGSITNGANSGVGVVTFTLSKSKTVDLKRYGMVTTSPTGTFGGSVTAGVVVVGSQSTPETPPPVITVPGSSSLSKTGTSASSSSISFASANLSLTSANIVNSGYLMSSAGLLTINPSTITGAPDIGLTLAFDGTPLPLPSYTVGQPNELTITTANGPVVFTRETGDIWTPVAIDAAPAVP